MQQPLRFLGLGLFWFALLTPLVAQAADAPRVVVVSSQQKGGPKIQPQVASYVERGLKKSTTLLPFSSYYSAARAAGFKGNAVFGPEAAVPGGRGAGASHILFVTSSTEAGGKHGRTAAVAVASLIAVSTGETLFTHRYTLSSKRLTASQGASIVAAVNEHLAPAIAPSPALAMPTAPSAPRPSETPAPIMAPPDSRLPPDIDGNGASADAALPAPAGADVAPPEASAAAVPAATPAPQADPPAVVAGVDGRLPSWRPGLSAAIGALVYWRTATLDAGVGANPPCYCAPAGTMQPTFSRLALRADLYPLAFGGTGRWWEGFGVHLDTSIGWPRTSLGNGVVTSQPSGQVLANAQYRLVVADSHLAPDVFFGVGYASYSFPLSGAVFPGLGFQSVTIDLGTNVPLGTDAIALVARADLMPHLSGFGGNSALGIQSGGGFGVHLEAGLKGHMFGLVDLSALFMFENYNLGYKGSTRLSHTDTQFANVAVTDRLLGVYILAGVTL
jgi:hypothetical protein